MVVVILQVAEEAVDILLHQLLMEHLPVVVAEADILAVHQEEEEVVVEELEFLLQSELNKLLLLTLAQEGVEEGVVVVS